MPRRLLDARLSDATVLSGVAGAIVLISFVIPGCYDLSLPERDELQAGAGGTPGEENRAGAGASGAPSAGNAGVLPAGSGGAPTGGAGGEPSTAGTSGEPSTAGTSGRPSTAGTSGQPSVGGSAGGGTAGASTGGATSSGGSAGTAGDQTGGNAGETETGGSGGEPETGGSGGTGGGSLGLPGDTCGNDNECQSGNCRHGICCTAGSECCDDDTDCADYGDGNGNLACDLLRFECYAECGPGGDDDNARCADGYHCDANDCTPDLAHSEPCDEGSDCVSGECWDLHCCQHAGLCCAADLDCPDLFDGCATDQSQTCVYSTFAFPDTGQTDCYDVTSSVATCSTIDEGQNYHGQDGHYDGPPRAYTDLADGTVRDETTGLLWTQADSAIVSFSEADTYCSELTLAGHTWRLPKRHELLTLVDYDSTEAVGIDTAFTVTTGVDEDDFILWTGTPFAGSPSTTAWAIDFGAGTMIRLGHAGGYDPRALCVVQQEGV